MTTTLPEIEIVDLPALDDEIPCTITVDDSPPCTAPAAWRLLARCPACDLRGVETVCHKHRQVMISRGLGETMKTACCGVVLDARWERL